MDKYKISETEINTNNVKSAANTLKGDPEDNKNVFDRLPELIAKKFNNFIDWLKTAMLTEEDLQEATNDALAQAKASGDFDGTSVTITAVVENTNDGGTNTVTFNDGTRLNIKNGKKGSAGTSATHSWDGTTLTITSASGKSSADLKGEKGDEGDDGLSVYYYNVDLDSGGRAIIKSDIDTFGRNIVAGDFVISRNGFLFKVDKTTDKFAILAYCAGLKGDKGYTPQKGTDYWIPEDIAEMVEETVKNIPTASATTKGTVKVGEGLAMTGDVLSVDTSILTWKNITDRPFYDDSVVLYENNAVHFDSYGNAVRTPIEEIFLVEGEEYTVEVNNGDPISVVCKKWEDDLSEGYWFYELDLWSFKFGIWEEPSGKCELVIEGELRDYTLSMKVSKISVKKLDSNLVDLDDYAQKKDIPKPYKLPVGGYFLGGVKNGGNVVINDDGTMTAPTSGGVNSWNDLTDRPFGEESVVFYENPSMTLIKEFPDEPQCYYNEEIDSYSLVIGKTYEIEINGNRYTGICEDISMDNDGSALNVEFDDGKFEVSEGLGAYDVLTITFWSDKFYDEPISVKLSEKTIKTLDTKYLPEQLQFGDEYEVVLYENNELYLDMGEGHDTIESNFLVIGETYKVEINDEVYSCVCTKSDVEEDYGVLQVAGKFEIITWTSEGEDRLYFVGMYGDGEISLKISKKAIKTLDTKYLPEHFGKDGFSTYKCAAEPTYVADRDYYYISPSDVATSDRTIQVNDFIIAPSGKMFAVTGVGPAITLALFADLKGAKGDDYTLTETDKAEIAEEAAEKAAEKIDIPTSLPASDVYEWAKQPNKPSYSKIEVGLGNVANERQYSTNNPPPYPVTSVNGQGGAVEVEPKGTAQTKVTNHNADDEAHNDIRLLISALTQKVNDLLDSDDTTLDQMSEVVAYIKANRELLESYTTEKVNVSDIIDNLTTSVSNKPLSAKQGVQLKALIDAITVPTALSQLTGDSTHRTVTDAEKTAWNAKSDFSGEYGDLKNKPTTESIVAAVKASLTKETWKFTLEDGSTVTKAVYVG